MRPTVFLGIDGMDPVVTEELLAAGQLPNLERLAGVGHYGPLATINPPQSPVVWSTIATGLSPAGHGIQDFIQRDPASYRPYLSLHQQEKGRYRNPVQGETFWERLAGRGEPATLLKWPLGFPPRPFSGRLLAGLGVPDVKGMLGSYGLLTTAPDRLPSDAKGRITRLSFQNGKAQADIAGPFAASLTGRKEALLPCTVQLEDAGVTLRIGRQTFRLAPGQWSPWLTLRFDVGFFKQVTARCRILLRSVRPECELYLTPMQVDYASPEMPISTPAPYAGELQQAIGDYATLGIAEDTAAVNDGALDDGQFIALCDGIMAERERMFTHELARFDQGLLACVFDTTDRIQHIFWRMRDPAHPLHDLVLQERYGDVIGRYYSWMDRIVGELRSRRPDARLIICSDHGFTAYRRSFHLNSWLEGQGYLVRRAGTGPDEPLAGRYDWSASRAYGVGFNGIYLNLQGREGQGIVSPAESPPLLAELTERLAALQDNGHPVMSRLHPGQGEGGPDLYAGYAPGYRASWQTAVGGGVDGILCDDNRKPWSGDHCCDAALVPGVLFAADPADRMASVTELAAVLSGPGAGGSR